LHVENARTRRPTVLYFEWTLADFSRRPNRVRVTKKENAVWKRAREFGSQMVACSFSRDDPDFATDAPELVFKKLDELVRESFVQARRFHRNHLLKERKGFGKLLSEWGYQVVHGEA